jgi:hypothetical protein
MLKCKCQILGHLGSWALGAIELKSDLLVSGKFLISKLFSGYRSQ